MKTMRKISVVVLMFYYTTGVLDDKTTQPDFNSGILSS